MMGLKADFQRASIVPLFIVLMATIACSDAVAQTRTLGDMNRKSQSLFAEGRYKEAAEQQEELIGQIKHHFGENDALYTTGLNNLALIYRTLGRYDDALRVYRYSLSIREKGKSSEDEEAVLSTMQGIAGVEILLSHYDEAIKLLNPVLAAREKALGPDHDDVGTVLNYLGEALHRVGRNAEAEVAYRRSLAIVERRDSVNRDKLEVSLIQLATFYSNVGRLPESMAIFNRAQAMIEKRFGPNHPGLVNVLVGRGVVEALQGRAAEAIALYQRARPIAVKSLGANHPTIALISHNLGEAYVQLDRFKEAEASYKNAFAMRAKALGPTHVLSAHVIFYQARMELKRKRFDAAERLYKQVLAIYEPAYGAHHERTARIFDELAEVYAQSGRINDAVSASRSAFEAVADAEKRDNFSHVSFLAAAVRTGVAPESALVAEAFRIAQLQAQSSTGLALSQMAARTAAGGGPLSDLVRRNQDLASLRRSQDSDLAAAIAKPQAEQDTQTKSRLRNQLVATEREITAITQRLRAEFPEYALLTNPKPLELEETQKLLRDDEALVFWLIGPHGAKQTFVFAVSAETVSWKSIPFGPDELTAKVAAFRIGLDVESMDRPGAKLFDLETANEMYASLLGPVEDVIRTKRQILAVPSGSLTALPLHLLVTSKTNGSSSDLSSYRGASWLLRRHAITVLPSVSSVKALRATSRREVAKRPMVGFGDPVFGKEAAHSTQPAAKAVASRKLSTRSFADFWQGAGVDRAALADALPRLEDTADELRAVAKSVGASDSDIHLRQSATETNVKQSSLVDYRVVYFATHGLVAGDVKGLAEPSLALTIPTLQSENDDGLLTASEIAQLKLNADWVVLSACNTIAGDKPGAEALSGLARAFFYAGARAMLVSHWAVDSAAATRLATSTFEMLKSDPKLGRAAALQRAMLEFLDDTTDPKNSYPAYWAPFVVVGDGAR